MLIEFSVENFRSFKEMVTLSMETAKITSQDERVDKNNVFTPSAPPSVPLLKSAIIYGANASGKSNLAHAFRFMKQFVHSSVKDRQAMDPIDVDVFLLSDETINEPAYFEIVFITEGIQYRYGFEVTQERVVSEWLFHVPNKRESKLFERNEDDFELSGVFREGKGLENKTRPNALFLTVVAQFNGPIATKILAWFQNMNIISGLQDWGYLGNTIRYLEEEKSNHRRKIITLIQKLDLGIDDVQVQMEASSIDEEKIDLATFHKRYDNEGKPASRVKFDLEEHESEGTKKIIALSGPLIDTLLNGQILLIDEFEASLHPLISREIVKLFHSSEKNPHNAQLIVMSHDTNLLQRDLFRRDQIWFIEKSIRGISRLYPLVRYKVRNDAVFEKDYILGRYGAIPFIGNLNEVFEEVTSDLENMQTIVQELASLQTEGIDKSEDIFERFKTSILRNLNEEVS